MKLRVVQYVRCPARSYTIMIRPRGESHYELMAGGRIAAQNATDGIDLQIKFSFTVTPVLLRRQRRKFVRSAGTLGFIKAIQLAFNPREPAEIMFDKHYRNAAVFFGDGVKIARLEVVGAQNAHGRRARGENFA